MLKAAIIQATVSLWSTMKVDCFLLFQDFTTAAFSCRFSLRLTAFSCLHELKSIHFTIEAYFISLP